VKEFIIVLTDGRRVTCSRTAHRDLFVSAIGGYGLFGIIVSVTLLTRPNTLLRQKSFVDALPLSRLLVWYDTQRRDETVCMYTIRVTTTAKDAFFKADAIAWEDTSVDAELEAHPLRHAGAIQQVMNTLQRAALSTSIGVWIAKKSYDDARRARHRQRHEH
jgi:FAD/FMN-containing dehydrogenase